MRQYYNIFVCTTVASIFPNCVLATSDMGVLILSHPMSLYNYYITTTKNIIISSSSSSHYHQEHHIIIIIIRHKKSDCTVKPHTEQTAYDDDISNSIDVQILWKILQSHSNAILYTWSQLSSLGGLNTSAFAHRPSGKAPECCMETDTIYKILQSLASSQSSSFQISPISWFFSFQLNWHKALQKVIKSL